uniref:Uncharacterized protein n=1 Tax=Physcomitrium patens TaxID=3218 RepID=A0A2K1J974_PHYPA|nr:hypothetical protein PHYPA_021184 [Physcomitrium patens]
MVHHMPRALRPPAFTQGDAILAVQKPHESSTWNCVICRCLVCRYACQVSRPEVRA